MVLSQIQPNEIVCPNCSKEFTHNKINGVALLEVVRGIETRKRVHCRLTLDSLEREFPNREIPPKIRKAILDGYSDFARDIHTQLGFGTEAD